MLPTRVAGPGKLTTRLHSVRPLSSLASFLDAPSTSTACAVPTRAALMRWPCASTAACSRCRRASLTSAGVSSASEAAGVPGRGLKTKLKLWSNSTSSISFSVRPKSSSYSPGKPTMKSLETQMSGRTRRSLRIVLLNSAAV